MFGDRVKGLARRTSPTAAVGLNHHWGETETMLTAQCSCGVLLSKWLEVTFEGLVRLYHQLWVVCGHPQSVSPQARRAGKV